MRAPGRHCSPDRPVPEMLLPGTCKKDTFVFCKRFLEKSAKLFGEYCISKMEKSADRLKTLIADILVRTNSPSVDMFVRTVDGYI